MDNQTKNKTIPPVMKTVLKIAKGILFVALAFLIYRGTREVLRDKSESEALGVIMKKPNESYDVILAGPSHMQYGVQPAILEEEYGIRACNVSTAAQSLPTTYYIVKEMIGRHTPDIVAVDLFCAFWEDVYFTPTRFHQAIDNVPLDKIKAESIFALVGESKSEFFINYLLYHGRWKSLTRFDYKVHDEFNEKQQYLNVTGEMPNDFIPVDRSETEEVPAIPLEYLEKLVELCRDNDVRLVLTVVPYRADTANNDVTGEYQQRIYNRIEQYAAEWGVDYINTLYCLDEVGMDFTTDMAEFSHLNETGSRKVSAYYGAILKDMLEGKR